MGTRSVVVSPSHGGQACPVLSVNQHCYRKKCPVPVNCKVSGWKVSPCSVSCGVGTQTKTRSVVVSPSNGGQACPILSVNQHCYRKKCPVPVNCAWRRWSGWSGCSKSCGGGTRTRS